MGVALKIKDELSTGEIISEGIVNFPAEKTTVQALIEARVTQEVEKYNAKMNGKFNGLVQPCDTEKLLNGYSLKEGKEVNAEQQRKAAIAAFKKNGFFMLVNDKQVTELEEVILVTPKTVVSFIKLVPLIGG